MTRQESTITDPAVTALRETSTEGLLTAIESFTHRIHSAETAAADYPNTAARHEATARDLRAQRRLVRAEILRRAGA